MATINIHYKLVAKEMKENRDRIKDLCQLYEGRNLEQIHNLVRENIELQGVIDMLLQFRKMGQSAKGRSCNCDKVSLYAFNCVTILTGPEKGMTGQIVLFGKGRGSRRFCIIKLTGSLRLVRRMGKNVVSSDEIWSKFYKSMRDNGIKL